ncbi:hypothetical protein [Actinomadura sp. NPDC048394]|uniref:hypothetical protein n=1 Tax=Actinomadura sp. NPDC048394 TaxID=3158223 RepID=UPI0033F7F8E1
MAKLAMTSSRWEELTALLKDEQRLRREYPKVAEYLDMAANLAGPVTITSTLSSTCDSFTT